MRVRSIADADVERVVALWERCGLTRPWNDPRADIAAASRAEVAEVLVGEADGALVATAMVGFDGHRGWVYYLAVAPERQGEGLGRAMMAAAEAWLRDRGAPKLQLMVREGNEAALAFYAALGLELQAVRVLGRRLNGR